MSWTSKSLKNPAAVAVMVAIVLLLGGVSLWRLPIQLMPNIDKPTIAIQTTWRSAAPREIESEINEPLEEVLRGTPGLEEMDAYANMGASRINMTFALGTDMNRTMLEVISRLNRLQPLPRDVDKPQVLLGGNVSDAESLIWFFIQTVDGNDRPIHSYRRFVEDIVVPRIRSVPGVAGVNVTFPAGADELQIIFDPQKAANYGIDLAAITQGAANPTDVSGGFADVGRRQYTLRFRGRYTPENLSGLILDWRDGSPITLGDIATITVQPGRSFSLAYQNGNPAAAIQVLKENDANVVASLKQIKALVAEMNDTTLADQGLRMEKSFDPSVFINRAIGLLSSNLFLGVVLSVLILWWFLREVRATLLIALAIPVSLLGTFIVLGLAGRTVNVISLAGLAFAVGMVVDAAIVVLENIVRLRQRGVPADAASEEGATRVWGALLASTATTVAIFIPVMFIKDVEGQLFADLALTIAIGVTLSLVVAVTILPTAAARWLKKLPGKDVHAGRWRRMTAAIMRLTDTRTRRIGIIATLVFCAAVLTVLLFPPLNYLPSFKRDAVDTSFRFPSGANLATLDSELARVIIDRLEAYKASGREPKILNYYMVALAQFGFNQLAVRVADQDRVGEMEKIVRNEIVTGFPDVVANTYRSNVFGGFGSQASVNIHLQSADSDALREAALAGLAWVGDRFPKGTVRPQPDPGAIAPELRLEPRDERISEVGWNRRDLARIAQALGDGVWMGEYFDGEKRLDVVVKSTPWSSPEELAGMPLATPSGELVTVGNLLDIRREVGATQILRVNGRRTMTLAFNPPDDMALDEAMSILKSEIEPRLLQILPEDGSVIYGGSADSLNRAAGTLAKNFALALGLLFLIMAALFRSLKDSALVLISIPLATVGGMAALRLLNLVTFQPLDLLTMIGFIILLGLVVNNAILLVVETRRGEAEGLARRAAVERALQLRLRPIFMSTLTSLFGMLPLLLFAGAGSAMYRGMAAAIVGGMSVSTVFTLVLLPAMLRAGRHPTGLAGTAAAETAPQHLEAAE